MNNNLYFYSKQFLKVLENNQQIINLIFSIEEFRRKYLINPQEIINVNGDTNNRARALNLFQKNIKENNADVLEVIRTVRPNKVFELINSFLRDLNLFDSMYNDQNELVKLLKEFPENHTDAYSEKESRYIFNLLENSNNIVQLIKDEKGKATYIIDTFDKSGKKAPIDYAPLRIGTDQDVPLVEDFLLIFRSLEDLYKFICFLHKIDDKNKPLIINQISTGSWYSELLGIKQVVISIENLLKGIGRFIRDYITGKIGREKFENECKKAEAFINLMAIAKKNGIDNAELGIFKELSPLIENFKHDTTTVIEINEEEILKLKKLEKLTLLEKSRKRDKLLEKINLSIEEGKKTK